MPPPKTAKEARESGSLRYNTGKPCTHGHLADRRTSNGECWACRAERNLKYHDDNRGAIVAKRSAYKMANEELIRNQRSLNYRNNIERERKRNKEYNAKFPEKRKAIKAVRKRGLKNAKPKWVSWGQIEKIYAEARRTGMTVDHIVPLNNPTVCGLHVPWNLRLISKTENISKGNRLIEELICKSI